MAGLEGWIEYGCVPAAEELADETFFDTVEVLPLDGVTIRLYKPGTVADGTYIPYIDGNVTREQRGAYSVDDFSEVISALETRNSLGWGRIKNNFAIWQMTDIADWFSSDIQHDINYWITLGRVCAEGGLKGIWLDTEEYSWHTWDYSRQPGKASHTFEEYKTQVRAVAKEVAEGWVHYHPKIEIMTTFGVDAYAYALTGENDAYGLYKAFLDGLLDGMQAGRYLKTSLGAGLAWNRAGAPRLIETSEGGYQWTTLQGWLDQLTYQDGSRGTDYVGDSDYWVSDYHQLGFATWIDRLGVFDFVDYNNNFHTVAGWKANLLGAMQIFRRGWIYNQDGCKFFNNTRLGKPAVPQAYLDAMWEVRSELGLP